MLCNPDSNVNETKKTISKKSQKNKQIHEALDSKDDEVVNKKPKKRIAKPSEWKNKKAHVKKNLAKIFILAFSPVVNLIGRRMHIIFHKHFPNAILLSITS